LSVTHREREVEKHESCFDVDGNEGEKAKRLVLQRRERIDVKRCEEG